jgi:hypothetical protein
MSRPARATQADISRAIKAAQRSGLTVARVEVDGTKIVVLTAQEAAKAPESALVEWRRKRDARATQGR